MPMRLCSHIVSQVTLYNIETGMFQSELPLKYSASVLACILMTALQHNVSR